MDMLNLQGDLRKKEDLEKVFKLHRYVVADQPFSSGMFVLKK